MHLILTGATGLVGSSVLDAMIKNQGITKISILSRRPVPMAEDAKDPRINVIIHKDFNTYDDELLEKFKDATGCVWALGISQAEVSKEEYIKITKTFTLSAARAFQTLRSRSSPPSTAPFNFIFVSGLGASTTPGFFTPIFSRVKGETELLLAEMRKADPLFRATSVRPGFVDWFDHEAVKRYIPSRGVMKGVMEGTFWGLTRAGYKGVWSPTEPLGRFLAEVAMGGFEGRLGGKGVGRLEGGMEVLENGAFRRLAGLDK